MEGKSMGEEACSWESGVVLRQDPSQSDSLGVAGARSVYWREPWGQLAGDTICVSVKAAAGGGGVVATIFVHSMWKHAGGDCRLHRGEWE